jgi:RimJ/RimL family protein N-acetyltransferase
VEDRISLRDGSTLRVRPIEARDKEALQRGIEELSPDSRYKRFLSAAPRLSKSQLRYLTEVDHHDHEALVAMTDEGSPKGVARYVRLADEPEAAEVAVAVNDDWHRRGVATGLLKLLTQRAQEEGIARFTATALAENHAIVDLLREIGPAQLTPAAGGVVEIRIDLPARAGAGTRLQHALRHVAEGRMTVPPDHER